MKDLFQRLFSQEARATPRLTGEEAERIARRAADGLSLADQLLPQGVENDQGRFVWRFRTPTRGSWLCVDVDDATGQATIDEMRGR